MEEMDNEMICKKLIRAGFNLGLILQLAKVKSADHLFTLLSKSGLIPGEVASVMMAVQND